MIKIEITDPFRESPETLVRVARFLMQCAGHDFIKAPESEIGCSQTDLENVGKGKSSENYVVAIDELPGFRSHGIGNSSLEMPTTAPYQHCGESGLTVTCSKPDGSLFDIKGCKKEGLNFSYYKSEPDESKFDIAQPPIPPSDATNPPAVEEIRNEGKSMHKISTQDRDSFIANIELAQSEYKARKKRLSSKVSGESDLRAIDLMDKKIVSDFTDNLIEAAIEAGGTWTDDTIVEEEKPKKTRRKPKLDIKPVVRTEDPLIEIIPPSPIVNGNTLIDKILKATTEGKLTHDKVVEVMRQHGLKATKDIFTNDHLVAAVDASIDEVINGNAN